MKIMCSLVAVFSVLFSIASAKPSEDIPEEGLPIAHLPNSKSDGIGFLIAPKNACAKDQINLEGLHKWTIKYNNTNLTAEITHEHGHKLLMNVRLDGSNVVRGSGDVALAKLYNCSGKSAAKNIWIGHCRSNQDPSIVYSGMATTVRNKTVKNTYKKLQGASLPNVAATGTAYFVPYVNRTDSCPCNESDVHLKISKYSYEGNSAYGTAIWKSPNVTAVSSAVLTPCPKDQKIEVIHFVYDTNLNHKCVCTLRQTANAKVQMGLCYPTGMKCVKKVVFLVLD